MMRTATVQRKTRETDISFKLTLGGKGISSIDTSIPFVDHMLKLLAFHGAMNLHVKATGDIEIDYHHLMEDLGITFGEAIKKALGDKKGIRRYGSAVIPMDESLARVVVDLSGRPFLVYKIKLPIGTVRGLE